MGGGVSRRVYVVHTKTIIIIIVILLLIFIK